MRIIAGEFRGRKLLPPETDTTRPVTDRVKQSLFDILMPYLADAVVYDCFAGTGSMGLECLSRGAKFVTFFEADRSASQRLKQNIAALGVGKSSQVISSDLFKWFDASDARLAAARRAGRADDSGATSPARVAAKQHSATDIDLIFLDPPYRFLRERADDLQRLATAMHSHLKPEGIVIFRHDAADSLAFPTLPAAEVRTYGSMILEFLRPLATDH